MSKIKKGTALKREVTKLVKAKEEALSYTTKKIEDKIISAKAKYHVPFYIM